jgi:hypothetical protein
MKPVVLDANVFIAAAAEMEKAMLNSWDDE